MNPLVEPVLEAAVGAEDPGAEDRGAEGRSADDRPVDDDLGVGVLVDRVRATGDGEHPTERYRPGPRMAALAEIFGLDPAATEILALAIAADVAPAMRDASILATGGERPTVDLALRLGGGGRLVLGPDAPLRRWRLVDLTAGELFGDRRIIADDRIVDFVLGVHHLDARLEGLARPIAPIWMPTERDDRLSTAVADVWRTDGLESVVFLSGGTSAERRDVAATAAERVGRPPLALRAADIPADWAQRFRLATFLDREMALSNSVTIIEVDGDAAAVVALIESMQGPVVVCSTDPMSADRHPSAHVTIDPIDVAERTAMWQRALGAHEHDDVALGALAEQFALDRAGIELVVDRARRTGDDLDSIEQVRQLARVHARGGLDGLGRRITSTRGWDDLVLPAEPMAQLRSLADEVRLAATVRRVWGWADRSERGIGTVALFAGPSGTGKTLAAEIIANELALDLYRIDLSQVVSKWIGETEKNLARIFDAAETSGAILLFDEADALFGKRTEVRDSHDRYANVEVSYLLQRMESYRGAAILTTNLRSTLDKAFLRRIRHCVTFPFPDRAQRSALWTRAFPTRTPTEDLDPDALSTLSLSGGSIQSIALSASYLAAAADTPVRVEHVLVAARREFDKLEKPISRAEIEALS